MCGIVGAFDLTGRRSFPDAVLRRMLQAIRHRGPDQQGFWAADGYATGVARLILRDAAGGSQPMVGRSGVLALNGELFSYRRDREHLQAQGLSFRSASDTEVFLQGLETVGVPFLQDIDGQFALAFFDTEKTKLLLARDRFGITPLYYTETQGWLLYASEVKALFASGMVVPGLNANAIDHVLCRLALNADESCFANIHALPPGHYATVTDGRLKVERYAHAQALPVVNEVRGFNLNERIARLDSLMTDAVARRLEADAEVGLYLSGGVDSSLIAALAAKTLSPQKRASLTAYSIQLETHEAQKDESLLAATTARELGIRHSVLTVTGREIADQYADAVRAAEMPVLDHAAICLMLLALRVAADGKKAVLTGEGADEAFAGYPWQMWGRLPVQSLFSLFSSRISAQKNRAFRSFNQYPIFAGMASVRNLFYSRAFLENAACAIDNTFPIVHGPMLSGTSRLQKSLALDYQWLLAGHLLADKGDHVAMQAPVETRYPFLDREVVQFALQIPDREKIRGFKNKWLLRKVAERHLSHTTAWRGKHLFRAEPVIHGAMRPAWVDQLLAPEAIRKVGLFDAAKVTAHLRSRLNPSLLSRFSPKASFIQVGLSGVVATQLLYHLYCGESLCDLPKAHTG